MANTAQSKKRARQAEARQDVNKARRSRIRTFGRSAQEHRLAQNVAPDLARQSPGYAEGLI